MSITVTINGRLATAEPGMTVLEAARANGVYIPTLCHYPGLTTSGSCRLCLVSIEKARDLQTACTVPVRDGMVVTTDSEQIQHARRQMLGMLLTRHPYTCITCATKDACKEFQVTIRKAAVTTGCQYCPDNGQCELQNLAAYLGLERVPFPIAYRGLPLLKADPFYDRDYNLCILCGRCVRACDELRGHGILALFDRGPDSMVGVKFGQSLIEAGCEFCGACVDVCPVGALFDKRSKWEGKPSAIVESTCAYCSVGCSVSLQVKQGKLLRATGLDSGPANKGLLCVRGRFGMVDVVHSPLRLKNPQVRRDGRLHLATWDDALHAAAEGLRNIPGHRMAVIGSQSASNEDAFALQQFARTVLHTNNVTAAGAIPAALVGGLQGGIPIQSISAAGAILVVGANPIESHPIVGLQLRYAQRAGAPVIVLDPRPSATAKEASLWLPVAPGNDGEALSALATLVRGGKAAVADDLLTSAAELLRDRSSVVIIYGAGVLRQPAAQATIAAIEKLSAALPAPSTVVLPGPGNALGSLEMGLHHAFLPGYRPARAPGRDLSAIVAGMRSGEITALYLAGELPYLPELANLELLIVQDVVPGENSKHAHVVLPAITFAESDSTLTNLEGRLLPLRKAIPSVGSGRPGWQILTELATRLGAEWPYQTQAGVLAEIRRAVPAYAVPEGTVRRFSRRVRAAATAAVDEHTHVGGGKQGVSLELVIERSLLSYYGADMVSLVKGMERIAQHDVLFVSPADAALLDVAGDGSETIVTSAHGSVRWPVRVDEGLPAGVAFASISRVIGTPLLPAGAPERNAYIVHAEPATAPAEPPLAAIHA